MDDSTLDGNPPRRPLLLWMVCFMAILGMTGAAVDALGDIAGGLSGPGVTVTYQVKRERKLLPPGVETGNPFDTPAPKSAPDSAPTSRVTVLSATQEKTLADTPEIALWIAAKLAPLLVWGLALAFSVRVAHSGMQTGNPFDPDHPKRLKLAGIVLLIGLPLVGCIELAQTFVTHDGELTAAAVRGQFHAPFTQLQLVPGLLLIGLAEIMRRGNELSELEAATV